jgi:hypothetical protein
MPNVLAFVRKYHPGVKTVVDAKRPVRFEVTEEDGTQGHRKTPNNCAMVRALERQYDHAVVSLGVAYLIKGDRAVRFKTPESVAREIVSFDRHSDFAPGRYTLSPYNRRVTKKSAKSPSGSSGYKKHKTTGVRVL